MKILSYLSESFEPFLPLALIIARVFVVLMGLGVIFFGRSSLAGTIIGLSSIFAGVLGGFHCRANPTVGKFVFASCITAIGGIAAAHLGKFEWQVSIPYILALLFIGYVGLPLKKQSKIGSVIAVLLLVWIAAQVVMQYRDQAAQEQRQKQDYKISQELKVKQDKWVSYDDRLMPHIIEYVRKHPEKVSYPFGDKDERVSISGLGDFLSQRVPEVPISGNDILDPWGKQVFVMFDLNGDEMLNCERRCKSPLNDVYSDNLDRLQLGLYSESMKPFAYFPHDCWWVDGTQANQFKAATSTSDFTLNSAAP